MKTLGDINKLYNIQDTLILCEAFEQTPERLQQLFKFNPRKCNSASSFSGYAQRNESKCDLVLPLNSGIAKIFEKTLMGGFSCVNTRMAFDTRIFLGDPQQERVLFQTTEGELKRFSSTIIKMDENNQYGFAMTKPLLVEVIKKKDGVPTLQELEQILAGVKPTDEFGHMFIIDLTFVGGENPKILLYNELYPPFFEKDKTMESFERSCVQVMALGRINDEGKLLSIKQNSKTHSTLRDKTFFGVYAEELYHATTQLGWSVTCIHTHYTFRQEMFKKDFVVKNQNARKGASSEVDKNFYKLMNNSNFGFDCQNNMDKCALKLLYDGVDEVKYARTY